MTIAPVLFDAFPEDARPNGAAPYRECFNTGASADAALALSTPYEGPQTLLVAIAAAVVGLAPGAAWAALLLANILHLRPSRGLFDLPGWLDAATLPGFALFWSGCAWAIYLCSALHPKAKAWKKALGEAWAEHGADITDLEKVGYQIRDEVRRYADTLEKVRVSLNRLDPEGDELDVARYRLQEFIEASDLPPLGARAAAAAHITDPKVRQMAKEYEAMVAQRDLARQALEVEIHSAVALLVGRAARRSDDALVKLVHQL